MTYNYSITVGESFNIKTPKVHSIDDITKKIKSDGEILINHSIYPNGFEIKLTQTAKKIIISTNMELVKKDDGYYYIKDN